MHREAKQVRVKSQPMWMRGTALVFVLLLLLGAIFATGLWAAEASPEVNVPMASAPKVSSTPPIQQQWAGANQTLPKFNLPPRQLRFSAAPSDEEFHYVLTSPFVPLVPVGGKTTPSENADLAQALQDHVQARNGDAKIEALTGFLEKHPPSPWRASLQAVLGMTYRSEGYASQAIVAWEMSWKLNRGDQNLKARELADGVLGNLAQMYAWSGNEVKLKMLFTEMGSRKVRGPATEKMSYARQALETMQVAPEMAFKCGAYALSSVLGVSLCDSSPIGRRLLRAQATTSGMSLSQVATLAREVGANYQMARREPGSAVMTPCVVHWKLGHFSALKRASGGRYLQQDAGMNPTNEGPVWVSKAALDAESSGYFLVPAGELPSGWRPVPVAEGGTVFGRGMNTNPTADNTTPCDAKAKKDCGCCGMPAYNIHTEVVSLNITDTPLRYSVPLGPAMEFILTYNQRDVNQPMFCGFGPKWTCNWLSHVSSYYGHLTVAGGGGRDYDEIGRINMRDQSMVGWDNANTNMPLFISYPDGSKNSFKQHRYDNLYLLAKRTDSQGNSVTLSYDNSAPPYYYERLVKLTDANGGENTIEYGSADHTKDAYHLITKVTDPFGRFAKFDYDDQGRLVKITDMAGMSSTFTYDGDGDFITSMTTPYGTTRFQSTEGYHGMRAVEVTDPIGRKERVERKDYATGISYSEPAQLVPAWPGGGGTNFFHNEMLVYRNTFYWDHQAMEQAPGDYTKAQIFHWLYLMHTNGVETTTGILESEKKPLESRVWYAYPNQELSFLVSSNMIARPQVVARVVDGQTQIHYYEYNALGNVTKATDPLGRTTIYNYDTNNLIDLISVQQQVGSGLETLVSISYTNHQPASITDAAGQVTSFTYITNGQPHTVTNPKQETTTFNYTGGYLTSVVGPNNATLVSYTYVNGLVHTITDSAGYTVTVDYDSLDRPVKISYPDSTYEQIVYDKLDAVQHRDRMGRWSKTVYNAVRQPVAIEDAMHRVTRFAWCKCGAPSMLTDANGNTTRWTHDLQGRVISKAYPDGSALTYGYEADSSRLRTVQDASGRATVYAYNLDDTLHQATYGGGSVATAPVSFQYDGNYRRVTRMTDGTGNTAYTYHSVGQSGGGKLASVTGPLANSTISYGYDPLGRVVSRNINSVSNTVCYDSLGRMTNASNQLGSFTYNYVGSTKRLGSIAYPNGQTTSFSYYGGTSDPRLQQIANLTATNSTLSQFNYEYDAAGQITKWTRQADADTPTAYSFNYDPASQLIGAVLKNTSTGAILKQFGYTYDPAGNRTSEQIDSAVNSATHNNLNQIITRQGGGKMRFFGALSGPAAVTVGGTPAVMTQSGTNVTFDGFANVTVGTNIVPVIAQDGAGHVRTNRYQVVVSGGITQTLTYDPNGNLVSRVGGGNSTTYEWDAVNRLTAINSGTHRSEFTYDGLSRRVRIIEKDNGTVTSDKRLLWDGTRIAEERDSTGATITKRYYDQGTQIGSTNYCYTRDHLGSIREMTDGTGAIHARYDYDPYGRRVKASGDLDADFGFTGHYYHAPSGLHLALYRAYDADSGRWLSRDPIEERGGFNFYAYAANNPVVLIDSFGLEGRDCNLTVYVGHNGDNYPAYGQARNGKLPNGSACGFLGCSSNQYHNDIRKHFPRSVIPGMPPNPDNDKLTVTVEQLLQLETQAWNAAIEEAKRRCRDKSLCCKSVTVEMKCSPGVEDFASGWERFGFLRTYCGTKLTIQCP